MQYNLHDTVLALKKGDITEEETDAVVNAANSRLQHGAGVAGAIAKKGGPAIQEASDKIGFVPVGSAAITTAGNLKTRFVIHAVGPQMGEGDEEEKLRNATLNSLRLADDQGIESISFPAISTGIYGYPVTSCAEIMLAAVKQYCSGITSIKRIHFTLFDDQTLAVFLETAGRVFGNPEQTKQ